ncbi:CDP-alcohol phosphatidyltransferase [Methylosinus sp. H3A]|uniref:CDP-alcohol phosphatidyltransferase n=1 Tax=Methylosinus sp. H3A TaxID=2785786 RepID=UPI0018C256E4|nr:CDP-alcohol phosphatidyltransferase [Methylosinus sp. H3A]MBG0812140.1 CDP-alcohol phosphatidyltransferase [Methylosinus sp. H3A]
MKTADHKSGHHQSFLAPAEQRLVRAIISELPESVTPLQLTRIGLFGALVAAVALVGCRWSALWMPMIPLGVFLNWFGAALDGPLALHRQTANPRLGLVEHTYDLFSQILIIVAFGLSPFLSIESAFIVLICYLLFSAYTYIRAIARHVQQMAYIGLGATEFRILMVIWPFAAHAMGIDETVDAGVSRLDAAIMILAAFAIAGLVIKALSDARRVAVDENGQGV